MGNERAVAILKTLANGVDPATGEVFPAESPYQNAEVVRALYEAVRVLQRPQRRSGIPSNVGKPWTEDEDRRLAAAHEMRMSVSQIAQEFGRTRAGIEARLEKLGLVSA